MAKRKMTRADVEAEIRRVREHGSLSDPIPGLGAYPTDDDIYPKLDDADLSGVDLSGLDLEFANMRRADMRGADLTGTIFAGAAADGADLRGTTRTRGAILTGATMCRARFGGADLSRAALRPEDHPDGPAAARTASPVHIGNTTYNDATRWPQGFDPEAHGAIKAEPADG